MKYNLNHSGIESFAAYFQNLPMNYIASEKRVANGKFEIKKNKIKITWLTIPKNEFNFSYYLDVPYGAHKDLVIGGDFSYIANNQVHTIKVPEKTIKIIDGSSVKKEQKATKVKCIRRKPLLNSSNEYTISLEVYKGQVDNFAKILEKIPKGYRAISLHLHNSIFTLKDTTLKFMWRNLPEEELFVVTYKLTPIGDPKSEKINISGEFIYTEDRRQKSVEIIQED